MCTWSVVSWSELTKYFLVARNMLDDDPGSMIVIKLSTGSLNFQLPTIVNHLKRCLLMTPTQRGRSGSKWGICVARQRGCKTIGHLNFVSFTSKPVTAHRFPTCEDLQMLSTQFPDHIDHPSPTHRSLNIKNRKSLPGGTSIIMVSGFAFP